MVRCGHVLSAILKFYFVYFFNPHISLGAFFYGKWKIKSASEMVLESLFTPSFVFYNMSWYFLRGVSNIAERLPQHCEYHNISTLSINVAIMVCRCFLTTFCGNVVATLLKLSWNLLQQIHMPTFSQLSHNVVTMFLQLSSMTLRQHQVGTFLLPLLNIWAMFLDYVAATFLESVDAM